MNRYGFSFVSALFVLFLFAAMSFPVATCFAQTETAVHTAPASYEPGGTVTVTNTFTYSGTLLTLLWRPDLPQGWHVESVGGDGNPEFNALFGEVIWTGSLPSSPVVMTYIARVPGDATGSAQITAEAEYQLNGMVNPAVLDAQPNPLSLNCPAPVIQSFTASPTRISSSQSSVLSWSLSGATSARIDPDIGVVDPSSGSVAVSPSAGTTYTLTAESDCGTDTETATVTVGKLNLVPILSLLTAD